MKGWLILIAASILFGIMSLGFGSGSDLDGSLLADPIHTPDPSGEKSQNPSPSMNLPGIPDKPASAVHPVSPVAVNSEQQPAEKAVPAPVDPLKDDPELSAHVVKMQRQFAATRTVSKEAILELTCYLVKNPNSARRTVALLYNMPIDYSAIRPYIFQAVLDTEDQVLIADIVQRIKCKHAAVMATLPRTLGEKRTALLVQDVVVQSRVVKNLNTGDLRDPEVFAWLRSVVEDPSEDWSLKRHAINALGRARTARSTRALLDLFSSSTEDLERTSVLRALTRSKIEDPRIMQLCIDQVLDSRQPIGVRRFAVKGLASGRTPEAREMLLKVLKTEADPYMRRHALSGLRNHLESPGVKEMLRLHLLRENDEQIKSLILRLLK